MEHLKVGELCVHARERWSSWLFVGRAKGLGVGICETGSSSTTVGFQNP